MVAGGGHSSPSSPDRSRVSPSFAPGEAKRPRAMRVAVAYDVRMRTHRFFATTFKGLEDVLAGEIASLGGEDVSAGPGSVAFSGDMALCSRANLWLRSANRVVLPLAEFPAPPPGALYEGTREIPWPDLFPPERTIAVDATVRDSGITHSHFAAQKTKDGIVDRFRDAVGRRPGGGAETPGGRGGADPARVPGDSLGGVAQGDPGRGASPARRVAGGRTADRSGVRRRDDPDRGGADRGERRSGIPGTFVRVPAAARFRPETVGSDALGGPGSFASSDPCADRGGGHVPGGGGRRDEERHKRKS